MHEPTLVSGIVAVDYSRSLGTAAVHVVYAHVSTQAYRQSRETAELFTQMVTVVSRVGAIEGIHAMQNRTRAFSQSCAMRGRS